MILFVLLCRCSLYDNKTYDQTESEAVTEVFMKEHLGSESLMSQVQQVCRGTSYLRSEDTAE